MLKLKFQYFGHLLRKTDSFEKILMLGKIEGGKRRGLHTHTRSDGSRPGSSEHRRFHFLSLGKYILYKKSSSPDRPQTCEEYQILGRRVAMQRGLKEPGM